MGVFMIAILFFAGVGFWLAAQYEYYDKSTGKKVGLEPPWLIAAAVVGGLIGFAGGQLGSFSGSSCGSFLGSSRYC